MGARAKAAAGTHRRIVDAALRLYMERDFEQVSLDDVAEQAGVAVRTVLRRFGSKESLVDAVAEAADRGIDDRRREVPPGDCGEAARCVVADYEEFGDAIMRLLGQEERAAVFRHIAARGRRLHRDWVERTFAPQLALRQGAARRMLLASLIAITDVYTWKLLRRDQRLGRSATAEALSEMLAAVAGPGTSEGAR